MESDADENENGVIPSEDEWSLPVEYEGVPIWRDGELAWEEDQSIISDDGIEGDEKPA